MEKFKVLFIPTTNAGVTYWRMWNFAQAMHRTGKAETAIMWYDKKQVDLSPWEFHLAEAVTGDDYTAQYRITNDIWSAIRQADAVVFGMTHTYAALDLVESVLDIRKAGNLRYVPVLMEIDDNVLSVGVQNPAFAAYSPGSEIRACTEKQLRISDGVIVSTPYLQGIYKDYNENVYCAPNSIDWKLWGNLKNRPRPGVRIGWAGGSAHREDLAVIEDVIPRILEAHKQVKFVFVHGTAPFIADLEKKYPGRIESRREWTRIDKYPAKIANLDFDIALAPLVDSAFNRAKSNLRWLEAAALGVPCVASDVGHFAHTISNGRDGILCNTDDEWFNALSSLISDKMARRGIGAQARQTARDQFDVDEIAGDYVQALIDCGNKVADKVTDAAQKALAERENHVNDESAGEGICVPDGRGPATEPVY